jgi:hypothetical protein
MSLRVWNIRGGYAERLQNSHSLSRA